MSENPATTVELPSRTLRELQAAREIARAFLRATAPDEVYNLALQNVVPLVGAAFGCIFLRQSQQELLDLVAVHNWPEKYASYLSDMRVRVGNGPTGRAVAENRVIEVFDIFADPTLDDWWDSARELQFAATVSLPLKIRGEPAGAITFYFREPEKLSEADRSLLRLVADQLAATAEKAHLIEDLQHANSRLREQNVELEARFREAEEARRLKNEFLANVSHELRTPLTAIMGYTYLLHEGLSGALETEQRAAVKKIDTASTALMGLINDLMDLTQIKLGRTTLEPDRCDAVALARAALSAAGPVRLGVEVRAETPAEPVPIETDPTLVLRILQNLLSNAVKFTSRGHILMRVRPPGDENGPGDGDGSLKDAENAPPADDRARVRWEIEDTGIGIAPESQQTIFEEFRQVDGSATRQFGGTGLGLALARGLARRMGGDITVRSELGNGAVFTLSLPTALPDSAPISSPTAGDSAAANRS